MMSCHAIAFLLLLACQASIAGVQAPDRLRCEYLVNPPVIDVPHPRFFWVPRHTEDNELQTAYQVLVSTDAGANLWDSGQVKSAETAQITYAGPPLRSNQGYSWRVRYWDREGRASAYSSPSTFATGLLSPRDWKARWIGGGNELRYEFNIGAAIQRARVFVSAVGLYELRINGQRVGRAVLDPAWTDYRKRALYSAYLVAELLHRGANTIDVRLGKGRASETALLLQLQIATTSAEQVVVSDENWICRQGPVLSDSLYDGEVYDARAINGNWRPAAVSDMRPDAVSAQMIAPIEVISTIAPLTFKAGVYDFGQLISGWAKVQVAGPAGTSVRLRYAEALLPNGSIDRSTLRNAKAEDAYILRGAGSELWEPSFTYHGFRYVEVSGSPVQKIEARVVHSVVDSAGSFSSSNNLLKRLESAIQWTIRTNLHGIPTDNNQRDERLGWLGDAHVAAEVASCNFDLAALYTKFLQDIADVQQPDGSLPNVVPVTDFPGVWNSDPAWESAYPLLCWHMYREYGDRRIVEQHFDGVKRLIDHLRKQANGGLLTNGHFGDWISLEDTPPNLIANFYFIQDAEILSQMSAVLGRERLAIEYRDLARELRTAYDAAYAGVESQTAFALAIHLGHVKAGQKLVENVEKHDRHITTGIIGTRFLLPALTSIGRADLAYAVLTQTAYPGWGYMLANGATALWELWRFVPEKRMKSHNQVMLASAGAWLFDGLAGIQKDAVIPAFRRVIIDPQTVAGLDRASATRRTIVGDLVSSWTRTPMGITLNLTVPVNVTAVVTGYGEVGSGKHHILLKGQR